MCVVVLSYVADTGLETTACGYELLLLLLLSSSSSSFSPVIGFLFPGISP